jgi:hypothetical protein
MPDGQAVFLAGGRNKRIKGIIGLNYWYKKYIAFIFPVIMICKLLLHFSAIFKFHPGHFSIRTAVILYSGVCTYLSRSGLVI